MDSRQRPADFAIPADGPRSSPSMRRADLGTALPTRQGLTCYKIRIFAAPSRTVLRWRSSSIPNDGLDGRADAETVDETLELLWDGDRISIVVSSDLSHQHPCADWPTSFSQLAARRRQM